MRDTAYRDDWLSAYIQKHIALAGAESREEVLQLFDKMNLLFPNWVIITCPVMHPDLHYATRNCESVFGYDRDHLINNSAIKKYFEHVHDDDRQDFFECYAFQYTCLEGVLPDEHHLYRSVMQYRFKKANGQYIHLHDERAALRLSGSGNFYYVLFQDVSEVKPFTGVKLEIFRQHEGLEKVSEFKPSTSRTLLSKRERELVMLIRQGLST